MSVASIISAASAPWLGFRFELISSKFDDAKSEAIVLADIAQIEFPNPTIEYTTIPSLSVRERKVPTKLKYGDLTLRCSVIRDATFFQQFQRMADFMLGNGDDIYTNIPNNFVIACYDSPSLLGFPPIRQIGIFRSATKVI